LGPIWATWLNVVEGFFVKLTSRSLKRGVFVSVVDLKAAINRVWTSAVQMFVNARWTQSQSSGPVRSSTACFLETAAQPADGIVWFSGLAVLKAQGTPTSSA
jgi:hypothetical protein